MTALTLVLPLKGRRRHTMRFFWHANRQRLPYRIIVADGQVEEGIAARLSPPHALFPALEIDYRRCPDDISYRHYFDKLAAAVARVTTPYAMLCDNDDFIVPSGVEACITFLDGHPDYAGISGGVAGFTLHPDEALPHVAGVIRSLGSTYNDGYAAADYAEPDIVARVARNFARGYSIYYSVFRTEVLTAVLREMAAIGFSDLKAAETFFGARVKMLGKCRLDRRVISYVRQSGTSGGAPDVWAVDDVSGDGARSAEVQRCLAIFDDEIAATLRGLFIGKLGAEAASRAVVAPPDWRDGLRRLAKAIAPRGMIEIRRRMLRRGARDEIAQSMRTHGAVPADVTRVLSEIRDIEMTLEGTELPAFMRQHAADLAGDEARAAPAMTSAVVGRVSVVIPACRAAATIAKAVRSCLADAAVGEIIVVIDGPDEVLRAAVPAVPRIRVIVTPQARGAPAARNTGLAAAHGDFVLFLDADDFVEGGLIASLAGACGLADVAFGPYAFAFPSGRRIPVDVGRTIGTPTIVNVLKAWFEGHYVPCCSVLWRRDFIRAIGGWNEALLKNQDGELVWRACRATPRMALAAGGVGVYMQSLSPQRVSANQSRAVYEQQMALLSRIENELEPDELQQLSAQLGGMYYRLARTAYYYGVSDIGAQAERAARRHAARHSGTALHRLSARLFGLRYKEQACAQLHRARRMLGLMPAARDLVVVQR